MDDFKWTVIGSGDSHHIHFNHDESYLLTPFKTNRVHYRLKIATVFEDPFVQIDFSAIPREGICDRGLSCWSSSEENKNIEYCCTGLVMDLLSRLKFDLSLAVHIQAVAGNNYGLLVNKTWTGLIGQLYHGDADMAAAPVSVTRQRMSVIDYTYPFMDDGPILMTLSEKYSMPDINLAVFSPLKWKMWLTIFVMVLLASIFLVVCEKIEGRHKLLKYTWKDSITYLMSLLFQRDIGAKDPRYAASRVNAISIALASLVIMTTYTAVLTANGVITHFQLPITGFKDSKVRSIYVEKEPLSFSFIIIFISYNKSFI